MKRILRRTAAAVLTLSVFFLSGCSELSGLDAQTLMSPPRTTADREAVYRLLQGGSDEPVSLVYPKNGDHRSAVISRDLNGDGTAEAVGFYVPPEAAGLAMQVLMKDGESAWRSIGTFSSAASQVDKVFFGDLNGDGTEEVVVGWGDPQTSTAGASAYRVTGESAAELFSAPVPYSEMLLTDFDEDGISELFVLDVAVPGTAGEEGETPAPLGSLYRFNGENPYVDSTVPLDLSVTRYSTVQFARLDGSVRAAILDGYRADGHMITQVIGLELNGKTLNAPLSNLSADAVNPTDRVPAVSVTSRDINGDGAVEIPSAAPALSWGDPPTDSTGYIVTWNTYRAGTGQMAPSVRSIINSSENYLVRLPEDGESYACANDTVTRTATFYTFTGRSSALKNVFSVTVFTEEAWETKRDALAENEFFLSGVAGRVYMMTVLDSAWRTEERTAQLLAGFSVLNE